MKKVLIHTICVYVIGLLLSIAFCTVAVGQECKKFEDDGYIITISKAGKTTLKQIEWVIICSNLVEFRVTPTSVATFEKTNKGWVKYGATKPCKVLDQDGKRYFIESDKKSYFYTIKS